MESNIPTLPYKDWLINQQKPSRDDKEYVPFWLKHIEYCKSGVIVGGIHISGWLYWHLNFFIIMDDQEDDYGNEIRMPINPELRDNEWLLEWAFKQARNQDNKPIMAFGTRRFAKSVIESSQLAYSSFIRENSFYVIAGGSSADINNITNYYDDFYEQRPDCFSDFMINGDWGRISKPVVIEFNHRKVKKKDINPVSYNLFPLKDKPNDTSFTFSRVAVRNLEHGQVKSKEELLAGLTPTGLGWDEALAEYELIPTAHEGFKRVKEIEEGDFILGKSGKPVEVLQKIDVGVREIYRITLNDGRQIDSCGNHVWHVFDNKKGCFVDKTTEELISNYVCYQKDNRYPHKKYKKRRYSIPLCEPVKFSEKDLPIEPYFLGLYLGDGCKSSGYIGTNDNEIVEYVRDYAKRLGLDTTESNNSVSKNFTNIGIVNTNKKKFVKNKVKQILKSLDVLGENKHIPDIYLTGSKQQRLELLAGLLDTDGTIGKNGAVSFTNTNSKIIKGILSLLGSLGIRYKVIDKVGKVNGETKKKAWTVLIYSNFNLFKLCRKANRFIKKDNKKAVSYREKVSIDNIQLLAKKSQAYCFKVDAPDHLFLAGNYIVTHNCGKYSYTKQRSAVKPAIMSKKGKRRFVELMVGTGGNIELATSAKEDFMNADKSGFLVFDADDYRKEVKEKYFPFQRETDKKTGLFVPAEMSMAGGDKIKIPLYEYLNKKFTKKQKEEMEGLYIYVTDWENARERVEKIIADEAAISRDRGKKAQMYYPFQPEHCFLHIGNNPFPVEEAQKAYDRIMSDTGGVYGEYIELDNDKYGNIIVNESDKEPIIEYPFKGGAHDAPIVIYERPIFENPVNIKRGTYIAGFDGAKIATSKVTDSTITMYIYKRVAGVSGFQNQIVASISGRPNVETAIYRQCLLLLRMYNAELLPEQDTNLYKYLKDQKALNYLAAAKGINLRINQKSKAETNYGLPPTSANKNHGLLLLKDYCWEQIPTGEVGENGEQIFTLGVETIPDPMLLKEIIEFGNVDNYDRIVAFYHCLIWDEELRINNISGSVQRQQIQTNTALKLADGYTGRNKKYARRR